MELYVITTAFPPKDSAAARSFFKLIYPIHQDPEFQLHITTTHPAMYRSIDRSLDAFAGEIDVQNVMWSGQKYISRMNKVLKWHTDSFFVFPEKCKRILDRQSPADLYFLRAQSFSTFYLSDYINKTLHRPVVLFYSDPWLFNPYKIWNTSLQRRTARREMKALQSASGVIFTNEETRDVTLNRYRSLDLKAAIIPHAYLDNLFDLKADRQLNNEKSNRKISLVFAGYFYGNRQPWTLFKAIARLKEKDKALFDSFNLYLIGPDATLYQDCTKRLGISDHIQFKGRLDYATTLSFLKNSDVLVNIDAPADQSLFLPSKLADYLGCKKPIWTLSPPGAAASIVEKYGGMVTQLNTVENVTNDLESCLVRTKNKSWHLNFDFAAEFESYKIFSQLKCFLKQVMDGWK